MVGPTGYTLIDNNTVANTTQCYLWYKVAAGGETAATVSTTSSHAIINIQFMEISGWTGTPTVDVSGHTDQIATNTAQASNTLTNTGNPAYIVANFGAGGTTGALVSITNGWQEQRYTQNTSQHIFALPLLVNGAQTTTYTWTTSRTAAVNSVVLRDVIASARFLSMLGVGS